MQIVEECRETDDRQVGTERTSLTNSTLLSLSAARYAVKVSVEGGVVI